MMDRTTDLRNASAAKLDVTTGANELGQKIDVATGAHPGYYQQDSNTLTNLDAERRGETEKCNINNTAKSNANQSSKSHLTRFESALTRICVV